MDETGCVPVPGLAQMLSIYFASISFLAADFGSDGVLMPKTEKTRLNQKCNDNQVVTLGYFIADC